MEPKVSVVMATYNSNKYIKRCVESILNQTYQNIELIIVDDNSDDGTLKIIESIDDERISLYVRENKENDLIKSINQGIEKADGRYIARHDSDDWSHRSRIEKQVNYIQNSEANIVGTDAYNYDTEGNLIGKREFPKKFNPKDFNSGSNFVQGSFMFDAEVLEEINGYNEEYETAEDVEILVRSYENGYKFRNINEKLYNFVVDPNSTYRSSVRKTKLRAIHARNKGSIDIDPEKFANLSDDELSNRVSDEIMKNFFREMAQECLRFNRNEKSKYYAKKNLSSPICILIIILAFAPKIITNKLIRFYRKLSNIKVTITNKSFTD